MCILPIHLNLTYFQLQVFGTQYISKLSCIVWKLIFINGTYQCRDCRKSIYRKKTDTGVHNNVQNVPLLNSGCRDTPPLPVADLGGSSLGAMEPPFQSKCCVMHRLITRCCILVLAACCPVCFMSVLRIKQQGRRGAGRRSELLNTYFTIVTRETAGWWPPRTLTLLLWGVVLAMS